MFSFSNLIVSVLFSFGVCLNGNPCASLNTHCTIVLLSFYIYISFLNLNLNSDFSFRFSFTRN